MNWARGKSDAQGSFQIRYSATQLRARGKDKADIEIHVRIEDNKTIARSSIYYNANDGAWIDLITPLENSPRPAEYHRLTRDITRHLNAITGLADLQENDERQDLTYLANKSSWDPHMVAMASLADQFSAQSNIPGEFYYALFRSGIPANKTTLTQLAPGMVEQIWRQATKDAVIPNNLNDKISEVLEQFKAHSANSLLGQEVVAGGATLGSLLDISLAADVKKSRGLPRFITKTARIWICSGKKLKWNCLNKRNGYAWTVSSLISP